MQLDRLQIDLRPRPNAQALDLGFALLRSHARDIYLAWLALWLPAIALSALLAWLLPRFGSIAAVLAWWLRPLFERAPLHMLARQVFGEPVRWRDALRAWPAQLGGGWFRLLTWWRLCVPARGLYQPVWQLEGARGTAAAERRRIIGANGTARSAFWFGVACAHFEMILQLGILALIGVFLSSENAINPLAWLFGAVQASPSAFALIFIAAYGVAGAIVGPIYTACCFTLYLNRRATLEAWDIEIVLRQIERPAGRRPIRAAAALLLPALLAVALAQPAPASAATTPAAAGCEPPSWKTAGIARRNKLRSPDQDAQQARLRREVDGLFDTDDLRGYRCAEIWRFRRAPGEAREPKQSSAPDWDLAGLAAALRIGLIAGAILLAGWLLYRYRDRLPAWRAGLRAAPATEIGGLDIRPETLPDDVAGAARALWDSGRRRAALALLYRATLSRLVNEDGLPLTQGATEGDCMRLAQCAHAGQRLDGQRWQAAAATSQLWLHGAYGGRWPDDDVLHAHCRAWHDAFDRRAVLEAS